MRIEISWVNSSLCQWGRWALRSSQGGLGYSSSSILAQSGEGDGYETVIPKGITDIHIQLVDRAVSKLPREHKITVIYVYQIHQGRSERYLADALGISRRKLNELISDSQVKIARIMNDLQNSLEVI